ncbi:MAG: glutamine synthetase family protein [Oscillospiraceae bacterium]|jgi:glutamine synthetase|nr:glutamine synthetase family protein [Oscillospiraceae bacterium]
MTNSVNDVLRFVRDRDNDVKFARLAFCDLFGASKNISVPPEELPRAFAEGISFDAEAVGGFAGGGNLFLYPEPGTLSVLPWRPQQGRVVRFYCAIKDERGVPSARDARELLRRVLEKAEAEGFSVRIGAECDFYLFKTDGEGGATAQPFDDGGYFDVFPLDRGENIRRELCFHLEEMSITPESSHHARGPGQNGVAIKLSDALGGADNLLTLKTVVKTVAGRNGLHASFMPKPLAGGSGSGLTLRLALSRGNADVFRRPDFAKQGAHAGFVAGILEKTAEITAFLNTLPNSYKRLEETEVAARPAWSFTDRDAVVRVPPEKGEASHIELNLPDPALNPYLALALIIGAGLDGVQRNLPPPLLLATLPKSLGEAVQLARSSAFIRATLGEELTDKYLAVKEQEAAAYAKAADKDRFVFEKYFKTI